MRVGSIFSPKKNIKVLRRIYGDDLWLTEAPLASGLVVVIRRTEETVLVASAEGVEIARLNFRSLPPDHSPPIGSDRARLRFESDLDPRASGHMAAAVDAIAPDWVEEVDAPRRGRPAKGPAEKKEVYSFKVGPALLGALHDAAAARGEKTPELIRRILAEWLG